MTRPDPEKLMAFADGELSREEAAEIEALMAEDPEIARAIERLKETRRRLAAAYRPLENEPVPQRLSALLRPQVAEAKMIDLARERAFRARRILTARSALASAVIAATIVVAAALGIVLKPLSDGRLLKESSNGGFRANTYKGAR